MLSPAQTPSTASRNCINILLASCNTPPTTAVISLQTISHDQNIRPSSATYPSESGGAGPSSTSALRSSHIRQRSKSNAEGDPHGRRSRGSGSTRNSGSSSGGDGSFVLEVGESEDLDLIANGGLGDDGEVRLRTGVSKQRTWSAQKRRGKGGNAFGGPSPGGVFAPKLQEEPYPQRRLGQRTPGGGTWEEPRGGTGELSPCPSTSPPPPPVVESAPTAARVAPNALSTRLRGGKVAASAAASARGDARKMPSQGAAAAARPVAGGSRATAFLFPPPPPPESTRSSAGAGTSRSSTRTAALTGASLDQPRPHDGSSRGSGRGAQVPSQGGSGWVGRIRAKAPALTLLRPGSKRSWKGKGAGAATSFSRGGQSRGGGGNDGRRTGTCTCGKAPSECRCHAGAIPATAKRDRDRKGRPLPMRTASGKLKM